jgi:nucleoid-associated protein YgaU
MSTVGAATSSTVFDLVDIGASTVEFELQDLGSVPSAPESLPTAPPRPEAVTAPGAVPRPETVAATWTVVAGDHLWSIAAQTVLARGGDDGEATIAAYWLRLIDHNRDLVGDNPDLIHPGQMIRLPD